MIIDISRPIHEKMALYPANPSVQITPIRSAGDGVSALSEIVLGSHTGTHIDTLLHIDAEGSGAEEYSLDRYIGEVEVVEINSAISSISTQDIPATFCERVLLKTKNSQGDIDIFDPEFVALTEDGARALISRNVRLVGIDGPSIKKKGISDKVHELFLKNGIIIIEGLWLQDVMPGQYRLICLPLPLEHTDGVPVRAVLDSNR